MTSTRLDLAIWERHEGDLTRLSDKLLDIRRHVKHCGSPQPQFLFCLSFLTGGKGEIVEIGTHTGSSLLAMATAQKMKRGGKRIHTIDRIEQPTLRPNVEDMDLSDWVEIIVSDSVAAAKTWKKPIELLWIDGDHRYVGARRDITAWKDFVIDGGRVALHDYRDGVGVARAVHELLLAEPWSWRCVSDRDYGSIIVFERIGKDDGKPWHDDLADRVAAAEAEARSG